MESSHPLATESFSYSWLAPPDHQIASNILQFLNHDHDHHHHHHHHHHEDAHNFDFDISMSESSSSVLVHADKLFSNGLIIPRYPSTLTTFSTSPSPSVVDNGQIINHHRGKGVFGMVLLRKWCEFPVKFIRKYIMRCVIPRESRRVDDVNRRTWEVKSCSSNNTTEEVAAISPTRSPTTTTTLTYSVESHQGGIRSSTTTTAAISCSAPSDTDESSIYEAILYCKTSGADN